MNFLIVLLTASLSLSLIMLVLLFVLPLTRQSLNARTRYIIWIVLLLGLIIPFRPILFGGGLIKLDSSEIFYREYGVTQTVPDEADGLKTGSEREAAKPLLSTEAGADKSLLGFNLDLTTALICIWAIGVIVSLAKYTIQYRRFNQIIKRWGKKVEDPYTLESFMWIKAKMGLEDKNIGLLSVKTISTPMLTGLFRPVILLPEKPIEDDEMELILEHELTHYKHKDILVNLIGVVAISLHWFNPIVYMCMPVIYGDGESYCDETVLKNKNLDYRRFYGEVIISMIEASPQKHLALSTYFYAKKLNIKRRLINIMESHGKSGKLSVLSVSLIFCLIMVSGSVFVFGEPTDKNEVSKEVREFDKSSLQKGEKRDIIIDKKKTDLNAEKKNDKDEKRAVTETNDTATQNSDNNFVKRGADNLAKYESNNIDKNDGTSDDKRADKKDESLKENKIENKTDSIDNADKTEKTDKTDKIEKSDKKDKADDLAEPKDKSVEEEKSDDDDAEDKNEAEDEDDSEDEVSGSGEDHDADEADVDND